MMIVRTEIGPSRIHGNGCFASESIYTGCCVWLNEGEEPKYLSDFDDNAKFINHSETPNTGLDAYGSTIALKEIQAGDELTENYYETVPDLVWELESTIQEAENDNNTFQG